MNPPPEHNYPMQLAELWLKLSRMETEYESAKKALLAQIHKLQNEHIEAEKAAGNLLEIGTPVVCLLPIGNYTGKIDKYDYGSTGIEYKVVIDYLNAHPWSVHPSKVKVIETDSEGQVIQ